MNYTMLTDFYEITMANGYLECGMGDRIAYFDMYFRQAPDGAGFAIMAGVKLFRILNLNAMSGPYRRELLFSQMNL